MEYDTLLFDVAGGVARITLNRPEAANALNLQMARELADVTLRCDEDRGVRAVLLSGTGRMFCAGGDLKSFAAQGDRLSMHMKEVTASLHAAVSRLARMDAPVIIAVNGVAAGAGMSLACAGDLAVAAESARFTMAYTRAGLTPDGSATYFLPRLVGLRRAVELTLTNRVLSAAEAAGLGIVNRVVPDDRLVAEAEALATDLAAGPTGAYGTAKRLLHGGWGESLETAMELESRAIAARAGTADGQEGINAFLGKRAPAFTGA